MSDGSIALEKGRVCSTLSPPYGGLYHQTPVLGSRSALATPPPLLNSWIRPWYAILLLFIHFMAK